MGLRPTTADLRHNGSCLVGNRFDMAAVLAIHGDAVAQCVDVCLTGRQGLCLHGCHGYPFTIEPEASINQSCWMSVPKNPLLVRLAHHLRIKWKSYLGNLVLLLVVLTGVQLWQTRHVPSGPAPELVVSVLGADGRLVTTTLSAWRALHPTQPVAIHF